MKKRKIILNEAAAFDLEEIWYYTFTTWSLEQADRYHGLIMKEVDYIASNPNAGKNIEHIRNRIIYFTKL
jgi:toxin ParE1/3/4